jgi:arabinose-5-phosphate isomerase
MTETIHEMSRKMMGLTAVVNGTGRLVGVISDGDLRRLVERDPKLLSRAAGDCLHANPRTIGADELASTALARMEEWKITSLFILDENSRLSGALHMHDLLSAGIR